jgi:hypothetical protein
MHRQEAAMLAASLRAEGAAVYVVEGESASLRAAAAIGPDQVLLDPRFSARVVSLLHAHPASTSAQISRSAALDPDHCRPTPLRQTPAER